MDEYRKGIIDLSQPHLIPERIKRYAFEIFDIAHKFSPANSKIQQARILLESVEQELKKMPLESDFFAKTREDQKHLIGLQALINNESTWISKRAGMNPTQSFIEDFVLKYPKFPYPFFLTYYADNYFSSPIQAIKSILKNIPSSVGYDFSFEDIKKESWNNSLSSQGNETPQYYSFPSGWEWCDIPNCKSINFPLFNFDLLKDYGDRVPLRAVFVVDSFQLANEMELAIKKDYVDDLLAMLKRARILQNTDRELFSVYNTSINFEKTHYRDKINIFDKGTNSGKLISVNDCFTMLSELLRQPDPVSPAVGDAVVTAPVGGYSIPEYSDWSKLDNRDVFVFKVREGKIQEILQEFLAVTACIVRDTKLDISTKIKYVIMTQKLDIELKNNDIKYWNLADLFEEAKLHDCPIPLELENEFDLYQRKNSPMRTNPYVIEPFLRRRSWALLTGEEGTGKSFLAMALSSAIATGGKLFENWKIRQRKATVLYIVDSEMTDEIIRERMAIFKKLYPGCSDNFIIESVKNLNLLDEGGKEKIKDLILKESASGRTVEVLVLDHLLKLSATHGDEDENWPKIRDWIEQLNERGLTVLLLHHEYAAQRMLGSRLIAADAPARVHLDIVKQADINKIPFSVLIVKNRGGMLQRNPMNVSLVLGKHPKWEHTKSKSAESKEDHKSDFRHMSAEERKSKVVELRKEKTNKEIAEFMNCSLSSIEKIVSTLPDSSKKRIKQTI